MIVSQSEPNLTPALSTPAIESKLNTPHLGYYELDSVEMPELKVVNLKMPSTLIQ